MLKQFAERMWDRKEDEWEKDFLSDAPKGGMTIQADVGIVNVPRVDLSDVDWDSQSKSERFVAELHHEFGGDLDFTDEAVLDALRKYAKDRSDQ